MQKGPSDWGAAVCTRYAIAADVTLKARAKKDKRKGCRKEENDGLGHGFESILMYE